MYILGALWFIVNQVVTSKPEAMPQCNYLRQTSELHMCSANSKNSPRGSKYPIFKDSGPKYYSGYGFWDQRPVLEPSKIFFTIPMGSLLDVCSVLNSQPLARVPKKSAPTFHAGCAQRELGVGEDASLLGRCILDMTHVSEIWS